MQVEAKSAPYDEMLIDGVPVETHRGGATTAMRRH